MKLTLKRFNYLVKKGFKIYCLLSTGATNEEDWENSSSSGFMSGGYVDGFLEKGHVENPFKFNVYYTNNKGNWWGGARDYYRTAIPANAHGYPRVLIYDTEDLCLQKNEFKHLNFK
jgi:hypothetical protein